MGVVFDVLLLLTLVLWVIRAGSAGSISAEHALLALVGLAVLVAIGRAMRMGIVRLVLRVGLPIATLAAYVVWESQGDPGAMIGILGGISLLLIVLLGIYLMVKGVLGRRTRR